jgi:cobalt-precorrin 5A hydrolase
MTTAIIVLTRAGLHLARRLRDGQAESTTIFGPSCVVGACSAPGLAPEPAASILPPRGFATSEPGVFGWLGPLRLFLPGVWERYESIVAIMSLGIMVRLVGPLLRDKRRDPAVVVVDDAGRFAVSVLGGHGQGANSLAKHMAAILDAQPVITTASEAHGIPAVDRIGHDDGWAIEYRENLTKVAAAVVRREVVAVWQDAGSPDWWQSHGPWPTHFVRLTRWEDWKPLEPSATLVITDGTFPDDLPADRVIVYRPPSLVAGIGCRRGTTLEAIAAWVAHVFAKYRYSLASLSAVATVTLKAAEPGLVSFASDRGIPLVSYAPEELESQHGVENPSERVRSKIGIAAVAEPAAIRAAGASRLLVPKQVGPGITLALARRPGTTARAE